MACSFSSVITCINSALDDMNCLESSCLYEGLPTLLMFKKQSYWLRNLKTFVLCARQQGDENKDGILGSLLIKIEESVCRNSQKMDPDSLRSSYERAVRIAFNFQNDFQSLKEEIDERYIAMSDNKRRSNSLTADAVAEITEAVSENLVDLPCSSLVLPEAMKFLREHVIFLKNFCHFATRRGVDHGQMKDFLTHTVAVALGATHLCFLCGHEFDIVSEDIVSEEGEAWLKGILFKISLLVQKIKPIDPKVCEAYTQVVRCSKLSTQSDAPTVGKS